MTVRSLAILTHARQGLNPDYFLATVADQFWRPAGRRVLLHKGLGPPPPADLAILHVDLTVVPPAYRALGAGYAQVLNGQVSDIAKRRVADGLVRPGDGYDGPVVVKTDLNHAGESERRLRQAGEGGALARLRDRLPPRWRGLPPGGDYRVYARTAAVPRWVWRNPALVVQRLFVERHGAHYALHQWLFLGKAGIVSSMLGTEPLVKWSNKVGFLPLHNEVPEEIQQRRRDLGFDFGKFDYVIDGGRARLLDANTTPHHGTTGPLTERQRTVVACLASGL